MKVKVLAMRIFFLSSPLPANINSLRLSRVLIFGIQQFTSPPTTAVLICQEGRHISFDVKLAGTFSDSGGV